MADLTVNDVMTRDPIAVRALDNLDEAWALLDQHHIRHLPVVDKDNVLVGIVSHRDLLADQGSRYPSRPGEGGPPDQPNVGEIMHELVAYTGPDDDIREAADLMYQGKFGCLPVVDGDHKLIGILTEADFVRLMASGE